MAQCPKTILSLTAEEVLALKQGINFKKNQEDGKCYIIYKDDRGLKACRNQCKHQGGLFIKDIEDIDGRTVRCTKHYWKLNVSTMRYVNPPDSFEQDELDIIWVDGGIELVELNPPDPWLSDPKMPEELLPGEVTITYMTHACMELKFGGKTMFFDPWLTGPAFARGWWLLHKPPEDAFERLCQADAIYISHMHSDHLSYPTLKMLAAHRPDVPIYVGDTSRPVFWYLDKSGVQLTNINVVPFGVWRNIDEHLRFMIMMDGVHPEMDTCIIVQYKGHMILNTVDCTRPNGGRLPENVALMMSDFAGGASGFPMSFTGGRYTESWKAEFIRNERKKLLNYKAELVKSLQPKIYCPFAGYFVEAHPSDRYLKETNLKNNPEELNSLINKRSPSTLTWTPKPGAVLDLGLAQKNPNDSSMAITDPPPGTQIYMDTWDFDLYVNNLNATITEDIFKHESWIQFYYSWAGFMDYNLVARVIETNEEFQPFPGGYDYLVDFLDLSFPKQRPEREHAYLEVRNRVGVIRHVVRNGLLWDDLYIGFQNRISREPDIYHHRALEPIHCVVDFTSSLPRTSIFKNSPVRFHVIQYQTWDEALAKSARAWTRTCQFSHDPLWLSQGKLHPEFFPVGENIWVGSPVTFSPNKTIQHWHSEAVNYTYSTMRCHSICGHYTQVVWAESYKVGCAAQTCSAVKDSPTTGSVIVFVCSYGKVGNRKGAPPYKEGAAYSACQGDECQSNLCRDSKKEEMNSRYNSSSSHQTARNPHMMAWATINIILAVSALGTVTSPC